MAEHEPTPEQPELTSQEEVFDCPRCGHELGSMALRAARDQTEGEETPATGHGLDLTPPEGRPEMVNKGKDVGTTQVRVSGRDDYVNGRKIVFVPITPEASSTWSVHPPVKVVTAFASSDQKGESGKR